MMSSEEAERAVSITRDLVRIESVTGNEKNISQYIASYLANNGLDVHVADVEPGRSNVLAFSHPNASINLLLTGHVDTVPIGMGWTKDPVGGAIVDDRLYGRGSSDMKSGLAAMMVGFVAANRDRTTASNCVGFAAVIDEEVSGKGTRHMVASGIRASAALIAEPTDLQVIAAAKGNGYIELEIRGKASHAGSPELGSNAILLAAKVVSLINGFDQHLSSKRHHLLGCAHVTVTRIAGGEGDSIVPASCRIFLDIRTLPGQTTDNLKDELDSWFRGKLTQEELFRIMLSTIMDMPAMDTDPAHPICRALIDASAKAGAPALPVGSWTAACDGGLLQALAGIPTIMFGPGSIVREAHRPNKSVPVKEIVIATETCYRLTSAAFREPF